VDFSAQEARVAGERLDLTPTEYKLLYHLVRNAGQILSHGTLLARVWGREYVDEVDYIRVYIRRLRSKLGDDPEQPRFIQTERGLGYRFLPPR
jgi:two-component system KDP operon response regulator KdpE